MRMLFFYSAALSVSLAGPVNAKNSDEETFKYDGVTYVYKVENEGSAQIIKGKSYPGNKSFTLRVNDETVRGIYGDQSVNFKVKDAKNAINRGEASIITMR
ncbi:MAG: hypothetical protein R3E11_07395 [Sphingobium sp.]|nr:hypothetical protein [Sphingobium sp.]MCP5398041.1 hypothetical protein [Sphingomonas sp.]